MDIGDMLYRIGEGVERFFSVLVSLLSELVKPVPSNEAPNPRIFKKFIKHGLTPHEYASLTLQILFLSYLLVSILAILIRKEVIPVILIIAGIYGLLLRHVLIRWQSFIINYRAYLLFYLGLFGISFSALISYEIIRHSSPKLYWYYLYLAGLVIVLLIFRHYFKQKYGRDYTYGIVEEVKNDLVRVFVNDDIAANVKPGYYWLPKVPEAEPGRVVKILVRERSFRSSIPERILEVHLIESSQISTEPKNATE